MKHTYAWRNGRLVELTAADVQALPQVMDDIAEFQSTDGKFISGRKQWRDHLRQTDSIEMGQADIQSAEKQWTKKKEAFQARLNRPGAQETDPSEIPIREAHKTRIEAEVANRLYNRPMPDRKTLIKIALETARRFR